MRSLCGVLVACGVLLAPVGASAQSFGIRGGVSLANVNITNPFALPAELQWCCSPWNGTRTDPVVGLFGGVEINPGTEVTVEVMLANRGFKIDQGDADPGARLRISYVEVPVLGHVVTNWLRLSGGAALGVRRSTSMRSNDVRQTVEFVDPRAMARVDVSLVFGVGVYKDRLSLEVRYAQGLRNVLRAAPDGASLRHKSFTLLLGVRIAGDACSPIPTAPTPRLR